MPMPYMDVQQETLRQLSGLVREAIYWADKQPFDRLHDYYRQGCGELALRLVGKREDDEEQLRPKHDIEGLKHRISGIQGIDPEELDERFEQTAEVLQKLEQGKILGTQTLSAAGAVVSMVQRDARLHEVDLMPSVTVSL